MLKVLSFLRKNTRFLSTISDPRLKQQILTQKVLKQKSQRRDFQRKQDVGNQLQHELVKLKQKQDALVFSENDFFQKSSAEKQKNVFGLRKRKKLFVKWPRDVFYESRWLNKLINKTMRHGKKGLSEKILIEMMKLVNQKVSGNPLLVFHQALNQIKPVLTVLSRRVGRRIYQVPVPLQTIKQYKMALKWLTSIARNNKQIPVAETLANEVIDTVFFKRSEALKRKNELYDLVVKNRAYTHYRWI